LNKNLKKRLTFRNDKRISFGYTSVKSFTHSGFDKGHLAPDAAYDFDIKILRFTYLNSNILPEVPYLNRYIISKIEKNFRDEAIKNQKNALIITGGINFKYNSDLNFYVPEQIFKILIINKIRSIYIFPNTKEYWEKWKIKRKKDLKEIPLNDLLKVFKKDISIRTLNKLGIKFIKRRIK
jgi:endonuclease G